MTFERFIIQTLTNFGIEKRILKLLTTPAALDIYKSAFVHTSVNSEHNYEVNEQRGDVVLNFVLVSYFYDRFPELEAKNDVGTVARLKIKYVAKKQLAEFSERLGFWKYIQVNPNVNFSTEARLSIMEDVFEAFLGATVKILHSKHPAFGGIICYHIVAALFDNMEIDLSRSALFDAKTRLKELFDVHKELGQLVYVPVKTENRRAYGVKIYQQARDHRKYLAGAVSERGVRSEAEQEAAEVAIRQIKELYKIQENP